MGRLDEKAAGEAIRRPLREENIAIADGAPEHIVGESHGCPYFVQLWGDAVRARARAESRERITSDDMPVCGAVFERQRNSYYSQRYDELKKRRLPGPARAVAEAFDARPVISDGELDAAIRRGCGQDAGEDELAAAEQEFRHLGFVWRAEGMPDREPGIPGLVDYIPRAVPERLRPAGRATPFPARLPGRRFAPTRAPGLSPRAAKDRTGDGRRYFAVWAAVCGGSCGSRTRS